MAEANLAHSESPTKSGRAGAWAVGLLNELPYIAIIVLGLVGICWTSISGTPATTYWVILTPICAFVCSAVGWRRDAGTGERVAMIVTQIVKVVRLGRKRGLQPTTPRQAQFGADMNDSHASLDRASEIIVVGSRATVQGQGHARR